MSPLTLSSAWFLMDSGIWAWACQIFRLVKTLIAVGSVSMCRAHTSCQNQACEERGERGAVWAGARSRGLTILICIAISICSWELWDQQLWGLARAGFSSQKWFVVDGMMACQAGRAYLCCNPQSHSNLSQSEIQVNRHFIIRGWKVSSVLISKMMKIEAMNTAVRLSDWADETQVSIN